LRFNAEKYSIKNLTQPKEKKHAKKQRIISKIILSAARAVFLIAMSYIVLFPVMFMVSNAVKTGTDSVDPTIIWIPKHFTLQNFKIALKLLSFKDSFILSVVISVGSALLQVISSAFIGYGFARFEFKGKKVMFACVLFTVIIPQQVILMPTYLQYMFFDFFGIGQLPEMMGYVGTTTLLNTPLTFFLPSVLGVGLKGGLFIYIFRQFFKGMPKELDNAAKIDGCGPFKTFLKIMLPNSLNSMLTVFLFSVVWHWNELFYQSMFFSKVIPLAPQLNAMRERIFRSMQSSSSEMAALFSGDAGSIESIVQASALLIVIPILLLYIICQRFFIEGVERSGITE